MSETDTSVLTEPRFQQKSVCVGLCPSLTFRSYLLKCQCTVHKTEFYPLSFSAAAQLAAAQLQ